MSRISLVATFAVLACSAGCSQRGSIDDVPVGSDVQLTRQDGALVEGKLTARDATAVKVSVGPTTKSVPRTEIADLRVNDRERSADLPKVAKFREITVPDDTRISVRINTPVGSATSAPEMPVNAELAEPLAISGVTVAPAGSDIRAHVRQAIPAGKVKGLAHLELQFDRLTVNGKAYPIDARFSRTASATKTRDAEKIGVPAAGGAIVGAIIGGKKGAAIGAAAGGGAGAAVVLSTSGQNVTLESGTVLSLETGPAFTVQLPLK